MTTGRKGIPDAIKMARGTFRADRASKSSVPSVPMQERPKAPESLDEIGRVKWEELVDQFIFLKLLERRFLDGMEMYCRAWDRLAHYEAAYKDNEFTTVESGYVCAHPAIGLAKQARDDIRRYQVEFGFTPSSAKGVNATAPTKKAGVPNRARDVG